VNIADFPAVVTVEASDPNASEAALDPGEFTFHRQDGDLTATMRVFFTRTGTATSGSDFTAIPTFIDFAPNQTSVTLAVVPLQDATPEPPETVIVTMSANAAYTIGTPSSATVTIADND